MLELIRGVVNGEAQTRTLDLYGPPRRTLNVVAVPLDDGWRSIGGAVVIEDVSERRRVDAMRRDFVANISHELKTPVGALGLLAETLGGEGDPDVVRRLAARMQLESQRVARIIDDLLDLSRIESEEAPLREPVPVHLVVAQAVERVRSGCRSTRHRHRLDRSAPAGLGPRRSPAARVRALQPARERGEVLGRTRTSTCAPEPTADGSS